MKKILLLIVIMFFITGCKVEYNLTINDDLSVIEKVNMTGSDEFFQIYYKSSKLDVINTMLNDERKEVLSNNSYRYEIIKDTTPYLYTTKTYNNINSFTENTIFYEQYFGDLEYNEENGIVRLTGSDFKPIEPDDPNRYDIKIAEIRVKCNYKVVENNAMIVDSETNTYIWNIGRSTEDFYFNFAFDTNEIINNETESGDRLVVIVSMLFIIFIVGVCIISSKIKKIDN